jgi:hypothetical protein
MSILRMWAVLCDGRDCTRLHREHQPATAEIPASQLVEDALAGGWSQPTPSRHLCPDCKARNAELIDARLHQEFRRPRTDHEPAIAALMPLADAWHRETHHGLFDADAGDLLLRRVHAATDAGIRRQALLRLATWAMRQLHNDAAAK